MNLVKDILSSTWMISEREAQNVLPLIQQLMNGVSVDLSTYAVRSEVNGYSTQPDKKRVVVISIIGTIMKYDYCGDMGMMSFVELMESLKNDETIGAVVLEIDSGGGQASYMDQVATALQEFREVKPLLCSYHGYCASAAYYIASQANYCYAQSPLDTVGSIGTMCGLYIPNENSTAPVSVQYYYAADSSQKNNSYREALKGNDKPITAELGVFNDLFKANVKKGRPGIAEEAFTGIDVFTEEGIKLGLVDGIKTLNEVIDFAFSLIKY